MPLLRASRSPSCLVRETVSQHVDRGVTRRFDKEILRIDGDVPLAVVRKRRPGNEGAVPVILVHGFGQNRYAWHLPERSFANFLADQGFDVFNVDLRGHGRSRRLGSPQSKGVDEYIRGDVPAVIEAVRRTTGYRRVFVMGHSLGGLCVAAAAARAPEAVAGVITVGSPHAFCRGHAFLAAFFGTGGHTLGRLGVFRSSPIPIPARPVGNAMRATRFALDSRLFPFPVRVWKPGSLSDAELRSYMRAFDRASVGTVHDLMGLAAHGELRSRVDGTSFTKLIERSELPLLAISGTADELANPRAVLPIVERSRARDTHYVEVDAGHADLLIGNRASRLVWPVARDWIAARAPLAARD